MVSFSVNGTFCIVTSLDEFVSRNLIVAPVPVPLPPSDEITRSHTCERSHAGPELGRLALASVPIAHAAMTAPPVLATQADAPEMLSSCWTQLARLAVGTLVAHAIVAPITKGL